MLKQCGGEKNGRNGVRHLCAHYMTKGDRVRKIGDMIIGYFNREEMLLEDDELHNICSDIIESTFGYFKERISPNKNKDTPHSYC